METDVTMPDDPPEKDESSKEAEEDAEPLKDHRDLLTKELSEQLPDGQFINQSGQDDAAVEEASTDNLQTARKASKKSPCKMQQGAVFSGKILSFCCSECKGDTTYSPNDLLKHFQGSHKGTLPTYPCDLCSFVTNEFASLQRHRIGHRNPQVTCEICNDGVQYSLLLLTRHYIMCHSQNGHFHCEKCEFSTKDAGTFVQHIHHHNEGRHKCVKCQYVSPSRRELQRHVLVHSATFPFTCHFCGYGAARKDYLTKHMATAHCEENDRKSRWRMIEEKPCVTSPPGLKLLLKKGPVAGGSREPQWMSKLHTLPGVGLLDQNGRLYNPEKTLEETQQFLERAVKMKKENSMWMKSAVKTEPQCSYPTSPATPQPKPPEMDSSHGSGLLSPNNSNGLTVLMVKNKISIPPNCTTKVMGFKMVDGKKHLVLKVIPTKQEPSSHCEESTAEKELDAQSAEDTANEPKYAYSSDDGEKSYNSPCSVVSSPLGSFHRPDSLESSTAGPTNDLAKTVKGVVMDTNEELPMEAESVGETKQSRKCNKQHCTALHENCLEDIPFLPTSLCEGTVSSLTKESKSSVHQSNGEIHAENGSSYDDPSKTTKTESSHSDKPLDSSENKALATHSTLSKATVSESLTGSGTPSEPLGNTAATSHSFANMTTLSDSVIDTLSDSSKDMTMLSHSAKNDISPSSKDSAVDLQARTNSTQSDLIDSKGTSFDAVDTVDSDAFSDYTDNEPSLPNSEGIPSDLTEQEGRHLDSTEVKATISDSAEAKETIADSTEDKVPPPGSVEVTETPLDSVEIKAMLSDSVDKSTLSESIEETGRLNSVKHKPSPSKTIEGESQPSDLIVDTPPSDSAEDRGTSSNSSKGTTLDSVEVKIMPSEPEEDWDATEDLIEDMEIPLNSFENKDRTPNSVESKGTPSSSDNNMNIPLVSTEEKDINSVCTVHSFESSMEKAMSSESSTEKIKHSDMADVASSANSFEEARTSHSASTPESAISETVPAVEETINTDSSVSDTRTADLTPENAVALQSTLEELAPTNSTVIRPSNGTEESAALSASTENEIVLNEAVNANPVLDAVPLSLMSTSSKTTPSKPSSNTILPRDSSVEKVSPQKLSFTNTDRSDETSEPLSIHEDLFVANTSQNINKSPPISESPPESGEFETPLSCATDTKAQFPESSFAAPTECFSDTQNCVTSHKQHSVSTRDDDKSTHESPTDTKSSELSLKNKSGPHSVSEMGSTVVDTDSELLNSTMNSPSQEVFSFHNYSKETSGSLPNSLLTIEQSEGQSHEAEEVDDEEDCRLDLRLSPDWSLTLDATPPQTSHCEEEENDESKTLSSDEGDHPDNSTAALERVSDSDIEVDECIAAVDESSNAVEKQPSVQTNPSEEDDLFVSQRGPGIKNDVAVLGRILEKHTDAIINHQLEKERMGTTTVAYDSVRPTKTTLKILQTPEGKQQMFLQTPDNQYAVPVQLKSAPGFKLITKSSASKINVSYMQPGIKRQSKTTGVALTLSGGRLGIGGQTSNGGDKGPTPLSSVQLGTNSSGGHYLVNSASLKSPILLSGAVKSSTGEQTTNRPPTCYLLQRPLPISQVAGTSGLDPSGSSSHTQQSSHPSLAKTSPLQTGRQAYLVRYISPAKSGLLLNNADGKTSSSIPSNESGRSRVFLKIVRSPNGTKFLSNVPGSLGKKPIYLATGALQSPCFLMSSNKSIVNVSAGLKASNLQHGSSHQPAMASQLSDTLPQVSIRENNVVTHKKSHHVLNQTRMSQRKRQRKALFDDLLETPSKSRRLSSRSEREELTEWAPAPKDVERTLRLSPFSAFQQIKCPRQNQPVVVLNHPDADIPEVVSIMKSVHRFKGDVLKVALSQRTVQALSELSLSGVLKSRPSVSKPSTPHGGARARLFGSTVRERFILKLKLKKMSRNRYEVVRRSVSSGSAEQPSTFSCWFCGRMFNNQEDWIGHGQRHLMEATRDWNKLF